MNQSIFTIAALSLMLGAAGAMAHDGAKHDGKDRGARMFEKVDTNGDGAITREEQRAFSDKKFDEIDANKDGKVTRDESKAHHEKKRAEWKAKKEAAKTNVSVQPAAPKE